MHVDHRGMIFSESFSSHVRIIEATPPLNYFNFFAYFFTTYSQYRMFFAYIGEIVTNLQACFITNAFPWSRFSRSALLPNCIDFKH